MIKSNSNCFQLFITSGKWLEIGIKLQKKINKKNPVCGVQHTIIIFF